MPPHAQLCCLRAHATALPALFLAASDRALWSVSFTTLPSERPASSRQERPPGFAKMKIALVPHPATVGSGPGCTFAPPQLTAITTPATSAAVAAPTRRCDVVSASMILMPSALRHDVLHHAFRRECGPTRA